MIFRVGSLMGLLTVAITVAIYADENKQQGASLPNIDQYEHINSIVVPDPQSPVTGFHHFYINKQGMETFQAEGPKEYPAGTVFVGKVYQIQKTEKGAYKEGELAAYTFMRKDGNDPKTKETGGWHFQKFDPQGQIVKINPVSDCFHCHKPHEKTDYVISQPLD